MRGKLIAATALLVLCAAGCGDGPSRRQVLKEIESRLTARDIVYQKLVLPETTALAEDRRFLEALESAGYIEIGNCQEGVSKQGRAWIRCPVSLTEKGARDLEPYRAGPRLFNFPMSHPDYEITRKYVREVRTFVSYAHTAVPTPLREELRQHGYHRLPTCGRGMVVFRRDGDEEAWVYARLRNRTTHACRPNT
jgi:hypothetical protein